MEIYLYLSIFPEALIASMLPPEEFGKYFAVGNRKRTRGQAIFFKVNRNFENDYLKVKNIDELCVPNLDGSPKRSKYIAIYRVLEHIPMEALENLYLVTDDGRVLEIEKSEYSEENGDELHLYQQLGPVRPLVASSLDPAKFCKYLTNTDHPVSVPKIMFVELILNGLSKDPKNATTENIPYRNLDHMRDCLIDLKKPGSKPNKTVVRNTRDDLLFRTTKNGFFIGNQTELFYYPFPSHEQLEGEHYSWWKSALTQGFGY